MKTARYERPFIKKLNVGLLNKFGVRTESATVTHIEGIAVEQLLQEFGSPLFVISEQKIRLNYRNALTSFKTRYPRVQFAWSYKTNYLNAVCNVFHQEGAWAEVVSGFEYQKAISNRIPGNKIIFNGPAKSETDLLAAIKNGSLIHIDHLDELYTLLELQKKIRIKPQVAIRVNMDTGIYPMWERFGFNYESGRAWDAIQKIITSKKLDFVGLHCHIGTFMLSPKAYAVAASKLSDLALRAKKEFDKNIRYIDLGGGFPSVNTLKGTYLPGVDTNPSLDEFADAIATTLHKSGFKKDELPLLILETGRALIDDAAYLLGTVIATRPLSDGRRALIVDFGVNILFTSFWYDHKISPAKEYPIQTTDTVVYGPLCMSIDLIRESVNMPFMEKGDRIVVHNVGAYNMTQWMQFITLRPKVIMIDARLKTHVVRDSETLDYISALEQVPRHLRTTN